MTPAPVPAEPPDGDAAPPYGGLAVHHHRDGRLAVVRLVGDLDMSTAADAEAAIAAAEAAGPATLRLDLSGLRFVDSTGVRLALMADARATESGRELVLALGRGPARRIFDVLGLLTRLRLDDDDPD